MQFLTGDWLADTIENTISNQVTNDTKKLEPIMLRALYFFASNTNKTVSHQELIDAVWNGRVVTEHVVYRVVKVLRQALAPNDRNAYILTIPKYGYKYAQSFEEVGSSLGVVQEVSANSNITSTANISKKSLKKRLTIMLIGVISLALVGAILLNQSHSELTQLNSIKTLTTATGVERSPIYLKNSKQLIFTHQIDQRSPANIYIKDMTTGIAKRITNNDSKEENLTASANANYIAFTRDDNNNSCNIILLKKNKNNDYDETKLFKCNTTYTYSSDLALSNNGETLYYIYMTAGTHQIFSHSIKTGKKTQITKLNQDKSLGEFGLALSPDNSQLAFIRRPDWDESEIGLVNLKTNKEEILFKINKHLDSLAWSNDGKYLYYIRDEQYIHAHTIRNNKSNTILKSLEPDIRKVYSSPFDNSVVIEKNDNVLDQGIWELSNPVNTSSNNEDQRIISSNELDVHPSFANTTKRIAFMSLRSGSQQIWIKEENGEEHRLTNFTDGRIIDNLRWAPDDSAILSSGGKEIYTINPDSGEKTKRLDLQDFGDSGYATWSADGKHIYFSSDISGDKQIYSLDITSNKVLQLTNKGALIAYASVNRNIIFLLKEHHNGLWQLNLENDEETLLFDDIDKESYDGVAFHKNKIYYHSTNNIIRQFNIETKQSKDIELSQTSMIQQFSMPMDSSSFLFFNRNLNETSIILATQ